MNPQMLFTIIIAMLFVAAWYSTNSKRNKIYCFYRGRDNTIQARWVNMTDSYVLFPPNKKFRVLPERMSSFWYKGGIHFFFPTKVNSLEYSWNSIYPLNTQDYQKSWVTPETYKIHNTEDAFRSYGKGFAPKDNKKQGMLMQYLPIICVVLIVIVGFWAYTNFNAIGDALTDISNKVNTIVK